LPKEFSHWTEQSIKRVQYLLADKGKVRRPGPWGLFDLPKIIVRATTVYGKRDRLAAIADLQGVWFTDKFSGIWLNKNFHKISLTDDLETNLKALTAYLQTRFASVWINTYNPSRKLRNLSLKNMPVPKLSPEWWERASKLVKPNTSIFSGDIYEQSDKCRNEWEWFNSVVEVGLGFESQAGKRLTQWFSAEELSAKQSNLPYNFE